MKKMIICLAFILISFFAISQTAEDYYNRGNAKGNLQDYKGAIADYTKAIKLNPNDADAYTNRGLAKKNLGDMDGYNSDMEQYHNLGGK